MFKLICLVLCAVAVSLSSICADEDRPASLDDVIDTFLECSKEHGVKIAEIRAVMKTKDVTAVNPCLWSCALKKIGFLDEKGQYVLHPGLTTVINIAKTDEEYTRLENIAKQCESVKDKPVSDGEAGCEMGALVAACFMEQNFMEQCEQTRSFSKQ